ncbi:DnaJ domain-containing protein [Winogradskyella sp. 3972H.M.0a.05]|uniref:DnaJ domain-containing protein n=1 Tax=Winogradskyella sp. 3972H.M.0a.05 TaxID=2950277 RepID=UPI003399A19A
MIKDYYSIFNIDQNSDLNAIKKAFRREIAIYHPDNNPNEEAKDRFNDLVEGFNVLSDPKKRSAYDEMLRASMTNKPMVIEQQEQYEEWQEESKTSSKKYRTTALEELLLLDIFLDVSIPGMFGAGDLFDDVGDAIGDLFDLF